MTEARVEAWLRGPVPEVPPLLQPVAHALIEAAEVARLAVTGLDDALLWARPGGAASCGYHLRHLVGSLDRLLTYARGAMLDDGQREALAGESSSTGPDAAALLAALDVRIERSLAQLRATSAETLLDRREVGRARIPSTVFGLLVHAAEHTSRHVGQVVTTAKVVRGLAAG
ncbi:MAG TPA: DinB family protein [Gemmatimonadaceae bacterium]|nr:DinB family protein [Gemmatimonadaceae bacterium]